jgi:DNA repair exonuclease SbcCD nuclease subunit
MRFVHTADWQLGMKAVHVGKAAERVRAARLEAIRNIQQLVREENVDFVLIAGDTFEDHGVSRKLVGEVGDLLAGFDCGVYLIPGNHDHWTLGGVWDQARERWSKRVHVLTEAKPVEVKGGWLYPCPLTQRWSDRDPTEWIPQESGDGIRIGLAHGSLRSPLWEGQQNHPIATDAAQRSGLDYLALGDWHSVKEVPGRGGAVRVAYCGTPEPTNFGEPDSGYVLLVDIETRGSRPRLEKRKVSQLDWWNLQAEIHEAGDLGRLIKIIKQRPNPSGTLVRVRLSGMLFATEAELVEELPELVSKRFLYGQVDDTALIPNPKDDSWIHNLPEGSIRDAAKRIKGIAHDDKDPVARRALLQLYHLANGETE